METVTLLLTRWPKDEFIYERGVGPDGYNNDEVDGLTDAERGALYRSAGRPLTMPANRVRFSGLWGTMLMLIGGPIRIAHFDRQIGDELRDDEEEIELTINHRTIYVAVKGTIAETRRYTTIERYRTDDGRVNKWDFGYVRMVSREQPYGLHPERNSVVKTLRPGHDGLCLRVIGGASAQQQAILIHEAPNITWVTGCIGPRPHGDRRPFPNTPGNPADRTVREIVGEVTRRGGKGSLFVLKS
ncbi:hypothetical protein SAZ10_05265 [Mesorhizobium sp. BAC0120]|uniref:hypothetical protein n=1 Tax=Mesorhizobium sp. BAC0120 TaxID=3090670 RepID=UPI00298CA910|nr:hypothetical protein [Mesorhizobium sp. BAC0120]MDW6021171.1 hypothetical protein [Mesorhizobium sp. BAC0120]